MCGGGGTGCFVIGQAKGYGQLLTAGVMEITVILCNDKWAGMEKNIGQDLLDRFHQPALVYVWVVACLCVRACVLVCSVSDRVF